MGECGKRECDIETEIVRVSIAGGYRQQQTHSPTEVQGASEHYSQNQSLCQRQ